MANLLISLSSKTETDITVNWTCDEKLDKLWYSTDNGLNFTESYGSGNEGAVSIYNLNQATNYTALTGNNQYLVRNKSVPSFTATGISALKHATISSVKVNLNEVETPLTLSGATASGLGTTVDSVVSIYAKFIVTDSRGITTTKEKLVNIYDWFEPEALITLERKTSNTGSITVNANYALIGEHNTLTINGYIKKTSESEFTSIGAITSDVEKTFNVDENYDYDVKVELIDALNSTTIYYLVLPRYTPLMYFDANKYSVGVNCFPNNNNTLEIKGEDVYSSLFYSRGESFTLTPDSSTNNRIYCPGTLINNSVLFSVPLPKSAKNVTPTVSMLKINACKNSSSYLFTTGYTASGYNVLNDPSLTTTVYSATPNSLNVKISSNSSISETNYSQVIAEINAIKVEFS